MPFRVHHLAFALAAFSLLLLIAGAVVTSAQAGLAIPDWPLSWGSVFPPMRGGAALQQIHRVLAAITALLAAVLVWQLRADRRMWLRRLAAATLGAILFEALLGGLGVLLLLPRWVSVLHACAAQIVTGFSAALAWVASPRWSRPLRVEGDRDWRPIPLPILVLPLAFLFVAALGAGYRHRAIGVLPHVLWGCATTAMVLLAASATVRRHAPASLLVPAAKALMLLTLAGAFLGIGAYFTGIFSADAVPPRTIAVVATVLHVAVGALALAASVVLAIGVVRDTTEPIPPLPAARR